jgi:hypothetical protein
MLKWVLAPALVAAVIAGSSISAAEAEDGRNGAFAAGAAAGVLGGALLGGALATPRYSEPLYLESGPTTYVEPAYVEPEPLYVEPPPPRCYFTQQQVENRYDSGWHWENVRVCR